jgi:hypothetical protein
VRSRRARAWLAAAALTGSALTPVATLGAQGGAARAGTLADVDSLLAHGRLAAAERLLYAAVEDRPRAPEARGALAWYLATRGRFVISDVLFTEALRFGADAGAVARARATIAPYRVRAEGPAATVPFTLAEDGRALGWFEARASRGPLRVTIDPGATGFTVSSAAEARALGNAFSVGERRVTVARAAVDPVVPAGELRIGMDVVLGHAMRFDERAGTLTLGDAVPSGALDAGAGSGAGSEAGRLGRVVRLEVPFVLTMPGLWLVERPGARPVPVESPWGRALLRGSRWWVDVERSVVVVER